MPCRLKEPIRSRLLTKNPINPVGLNITTTSSNNPKMMGQPVSLSLEMPQKGVRYFHGSVGRMLQSGGEAYLKAMRKSAGS